MEQFWDGVYIVQHPVDPEPHQRFLAFRFDVDVARPLVEGIMKQKLDGADHTAVVPLDLVPFHGHELFQVTEIHPGSDFVLGSKHRSPEAEELPDDLKNVAARAEHPPDLDLPDGAQIFDHVVIERVRDCNGDDPFTLRNGHDQVFKRKRAGNMGGNEIEVQLEGIDLDEGHSHRRRNGLGYGVFRQQSAAASGYLQAEGADDFRRRHRIRPHIEPARVACLLGALQPRGLCFSPGQNKLQLFVRNEPLLEKDLRNVTYGECPLSGHFQSCGFMSGLASYPPGATRCMSHPLTCLEKQLSFADNISILKERRSGRSPYNDCCLF